LPSLAQGAGGGMAAYTSFPKPVPRLCLLEAGGYFDPADPKYITQLKWAYESPRRGAGTTRAFGDFDAAYGGWDIEGEPYSNGKGHGFSLVPVAECSAGVRITGGGSPCGLAPDDFKRRSLTGVGEDWPIGYDDIKPLLR
jgi:choline dehydrogenase-like flavoprotein